MRVVYHEYKALQRYLCFLLPSVGTANPDTVTPGIIKANNAWNPKNPQ